MSGISEEQSWSSNGLKVGKMKESYTEVLEKLRESFRSGKTLPYSFRNQQLTKLLEMLEKNEPQLVIALQKDLRRPHCESRQYDIMTTKVEIHEAIRQLRAWMKPIHVDFHLLFPFDVAYTKSEPFGVALILGPFNYPTNLTICPLVGAIAAGNCAVIKPSNVAPAFSALLAELIPKYLDPDCYQVILGGAPETTALLNEKFDYIFLTGSPETGKVVMSAAAKTLTPVTLELGGKSPTYIADDANMKLTAKRIIWGKFMNGGQTCVAPDYILCSKKVEKQLIPYAKKCIEEFYGKDLQSSPDLSRIVNKKHFQRIKAMLDGTEGKIVIGGNCDESDLWIEPTVVVNCKETDTLMSEEIFGPILPIVNAETKEAALELILSGRGKPLALYVFTNSKSTVQLFQEHTSSGSMAINDVVLQFALPGLSFGGVGSSGMGSYHGKFSFDTFSHRKTIAHRSFFFIGELLTSPRYAPYLHVDIQVAAGYMILKHFHKFFIPTLRLPHVLMFLFGLMTAWYFLRV